MSCSFMEANIVADGNDTVLLLQADGDYYDGIVLYMKATRSARCTRINS